MKARRANPDLFLLFYDLVNAGSINKASEALGLPKSTISRKLTELEALLGATLVKRGSQGLLPTEVGSVLYERCGRIAAEVEEAGEVAEAARDDMVGTLRVSLPPDFWMSWFGKAVCDFADEHPRIHMDLMCHERFVDVSTEPFDVAIHVTPVRNPLLTIKRLGELSRGFYASPSYLREHGTPERVADVTAGIFLRSHLDEKLWDEGGDADRVEPAGRFIVNSVGFSRALAINGQGVAMLPNQLCAQDVAAGHLVQILRSHRAPNLPVVSTFLAHKNMSRKLRAFLDFIGERLHHAEGINPPL
jgi:DNA-binding transcriptional LysR family regulator